MVLPRHPFCAGCTIAFLSFYGPAVHMVSADEPRHRGVEVVRGRKAAAGEALVRFRQGNGNPMRDSDIDRDERIGSGPWRLVHSRSRHADALASDLRSRGDVADAEPNYAVSLEGTPDDLVSSLWALQNTGQRLSNGDTGTAGADIGAVSAWDATTGSRRIVVATVDTGIMAGHVDLAANVWSAPRSFTVTVGGVTITCGVGTHGFNAIARTCNPADDNGHGTHVAGSIGAAGNNGTGVVGVNWATSIMALKFLDSTGNGYVSDAVDAIEFAIQAKQAFATTGEANVRVLNNSWDGGGFSQALQDEIQRAADADMLFVAAAGNSGVNHDTQAVYPASYGVANVVAVGSTDYRDQLSSFSDYGPNTVQVAAPGSLIYSTMISTSDPTASTYATLSGTSMATAYVSGVAALVLSRCTYSTGGLRDALLRTSTADPALDGRVQSSRRVNAAAAVHACDTTPSGTSEIVLYASDVPASGVHGAWTVQADPTAAGGAKLATPDLGWSSTSAPLAAPADYVDVAFAASAGTAYHVWLRLHAAADSKWNDSLWVQFSDALVGGAPAYQMNSTSGLLVNLEACSGCGVAGWGWMDGAYWLPPPGTIQFATSGTHTLRIQTREDGVQVDQIVLSAATYVSSAPGQLTNDATIVAKPVSSGTTTPPPPAPVPSASPFGGSPAAIPGTIQAEAFDTGGEGVAYHDSDAGNSGGAYRQTDVDLEAASGGGYDVGWIVPGEWIQYTVSVQSAGTYTIEFRVAASGQGGTFHLEMNGANVTGPLTIPNTGGWQNWVSVYANATLAAGQQAARLVMDSSGDIAVGNIDWFAFTPASGTARLPGRIAAAAFDAGVEGAAYHDADPTNDGGAYRDTGVDLEAASEGGYDIGWIQAGEWVNYSVNVAAAGTYQMQFRVASLSSGGALHANVDGANVTGSVTVPATGGWQNWTTVTVPATLSAGVHRLTLAFDTAGFNVLWVNVAP